MAKRLSEGGCLVVGTGGGGGRSLTKAGAWAFGHSSPWRRRARAGAGTAGLIVWFRGVLVVRRYGAARLLISGAQHSETADLLLAPEQHKPACVSKSRGVSGRIACPQRFSQHHRSSPGLVQPAPVPAPPEPRLADKPARLSLLAPGWSDPWPRLRSGLTAHKSITTTAQHTRALSSALAGPGQPPRADSIGPVRPPARRPRRPEPPRAPRPSRYSLCRP